MEVVEKNEAFKKIDGKMQFSYVRVFARQDGILYSVKENIKSSLEGIVAAIKHLQSAGLRSIPTTPCSTLEKLQTIVSF